MLRLEAHPCGLDDLKSSGGCGFAPWLEPEVEAVFWSEDFAFPFAGDGGMVGKVFESCLFSENDPGRIGGRKGTFRPHEKI